MCVCDYIGIYCYDKVMLVELLYAIYSILVLSAKFFFSIYTFYIVLWTMALGQWPGPKTKALLCANVGA